MGTVELYRLNIAAADLFRSVDKVAQSFDVELVDRYRGW